MAPRQGKGLPSATERRRTDPATRPCQCCPTVAAAEPLAASARALAVASGRLVPVGAGFWRTLWSVMLPLSGPMLIVACILKATNTWNDYLLGLIFAGRENLPMTVQLNNIVNSTMGEREYNMEMAATLLTALVPLLIYFASGRWFVRGIAAGAIKG